MEWEGGEEKWARLLRLGWGVADFDLEGGEWRMGGCWAWMVLVLVGIGGIKWVGVCVQRRWSWWRCEEEEQEEGYTEREKVTRGGYERAWGS